jgi:cbb3-type cytochrome oxidase subunit 1
MDNFNRFIQKHFTISLLFLALGLGFGLIYSINLLGFSLDSTTLLPSNMRSLHISLMLYGFIPLMLSYLPFLLIHKQIGHSKRGLHCLKLYTQFWYIFLIFMISSLLFGNTRGLAFYDFPYELNFILALAGIFYAFALYEFIKLYHKNPMWVQVCLGVVVIAPIALLILMNPIIGQVESTVTGPHGDNTLGMSLALIPMYYLIIKLLNKEEFIARWNILWIIPTVFYFASVVYRSFYAPLTYNQEWFLQYLTLLYLPLLYRWYKDAKIENYAKKALLISIAAFLFVDIQGNILFIPEFRWSFHRNDLVIAHAHIAMGIGIFFMVIAMFVSYFNALKNIRFYFLYLLGLVGIFVSLTLSGFVQAGVIIDFESSNLWVLRTLFGAVALSSLWTFIHFKKKVSHLEMYNIFGILADGMGEIFLILLGSLLYPMLGFEFLGKYEYIVFIFVCSTGVIHYLAYKEVLHRIILTQLTVIVRIMVSSVFFALFYNKTLGIEALGIALFDILFASYYLIFLSQHINHPKENSCKKQP